MHGVKSRRARSSQRLEEGGGEAPETKLKASICIPSYNRKELLLATLRSLNQQKSAAPDAFEVIVADDGSSDGSVEALAGLRTRYRLRWLTQPNAGPAAASNAASSQL